MAIDQEIQNVIQKHIDKAVSNAVTEVAQLIQARVAGAIGIGSGHGQVRRTRTPAKKANGTAPRVVSKPRAKKMHEPGGGVRCISPNCQKLSKGPRFHFLCETHRKAPKAKWTAWAVAAKKKK
jgi:hypothetical protein